MMKQEFLEAMHFRHACKLFDSHRQVAQDDLEFILEAGRQSPSSIGMEHWKFVVTRRQPLKDALRQACNDQPQLSSCSVVIVILAKTAELAPDSEYVHTMLRRFELPEAQYQGMLEFYRQYLAKTDVTAWSVAQCHIAAANMMTAAATIGIDSCPIGAFDPAAVQQILELDNQRYAVALLLPLGYRAKPQPPKHRLALAELVEYR
jgi:nitroreductase